MWWRWAHQKHLRLSVSVWNGEIKIIKLWSAGSDIYTGGPVVARGGCHLLAAVVGYSRTKKKTCSTWAIDCKRTLPCPHWLQDAVCLFVCVQLIPNLSLHFPAPLTMHIPIVKLIRSMAPKTCSPQTDRESSGISIYTVCPWACCCYY